MSDGRNINDKASRVIVFRRRSAIGIELLSHELNRFTNAFTGNTLAERKGVEEPDFTIAVTSRVM